MQMLIGWEEENLNHSNSVSIFTDIQSLCTPLLGTSITIDELRLRIGRLRARLVI